MNTLTLISFLCIDLFVYTALFMYIFRRKKRIGIQLGMNISQAAGGFSALLAGLMLVIAFPFHFTLVTITAAAIGILLGALFGLLFDYQAFLAGVTNGFITGLMAPMLGSVIDMPGQLIWFIHAVFFACLLLVMISIQRS